MGATPPSKKNINFFFTIKQARVRVASTPTLLNILERGASLLTRTARASHKACDLLNSVGELARRRDSTKWRVRPVRASDGRIWSLRVGM